MARPHGRRHGGAAGLQRPKNSKKALRFLIGEFKPYRFRLFIIFILLVAANIGHIFVPLQLREIMSSFSQSSSRFGYYFKDLANPNLGLDWTKLFIDFGVIFGLIVLSSILSTITTFIAIRISGDYAYKLRNKIRDKFDNLPLSYFDKHPYGELLSIGTNDVDAIASSLNQVVTTIVSSVTLFFGILIAMFVVNWRLALVALATLPLSIFVTFLVTKNSQRQFVTLQKKTGELEGHVEENFAGLQVVQLFNQQEKQYDTCDICQNNSIVNSHNITIIIYTCTID